MLTLTPSQIEDALYYIEAYGTAENAATGSLIDANANITQKTLSTLENELYKPLTACLNRALVKEKLRTLFGEEVAIDYEDDINNHTIYVHDETSLKPYCASISLYPFLLEGTKNMGGISGPPKNLQSFCGSFVNLIYQVSSNFAGAIATVEFLHYFDWFARKEYGKDYLTAHEKEINQELQGVVYALNQPASARGDQSVFWNISVFDAPYLKSMFGKFYYPDGTTVDFESVMALERHFMEWFREERTKELLTFPVVTASLLTTEAGFSDDAFKTFLADQMSRGHSFFVYMSDTVDSLASCCRLRNELTDNTFSYTLGAGGIITGSAQVITLNVNRIIQDAIKHESTKGVGDIDWTHDVKAVITRVHQYLAASKDIYQDFIEAGLLPAYTAGYMDIDKQFLTIGLNGVVEAAEYLEIKIGSPEYKDFLQKLLQLFKTMNQIGSKKYGLRFNTEFVPAENLGVKNAKWDKEDGYFSPRACYNSYFYAVEDDRLTLLDKIALYGKSITENLDGGSALHLNLEQHLNQTNAIMLFEACRKAGVPYWTTNVKCTICNDCGYINPETEFCCTKCKSTNVDYGTRIIGYLKRIKSFSAERQEEAKKRFYHERWYR